MTTLREAGFKATQVAANSTMSLAMGTLANGRLVVVGKTPDGEGYTEYHTIGEALLAFDRIMLGAGLVEVTK